MSDTPLTDALLMCHLLGRENDALKIKARRWDEVLNYVGVEADSRGRWDFTIEGLDDSQVGLIDGNVTEHFTNAIDKKLKDKS